MAEIPLHLYPEVADKLDHALIPTTVEVIDGIPRLRIRVFGVIIHGEITSEYNPRLSNGGESNRRGTG